MATNVETFMRREPTLVFLEMIIRLLSGGEVTLGSQPQALTISVEMLPSVRDCLALAQRTKKSVALSPSITISFAPSFQGARLAESHP